MQKPLKLFKRTFEALKHAKGTAQRDALNCDAKTSEYMPSYKWIVEDKDGLTRDFRTKQDAVKFINSFLD